MRITVFGAGAVGSLLGARLAAAGHAVRLIGRPAVVAAVHERGLAVEGVGPARVAVTAVRALSGADRPDALLLTVKTYDLDAAVDALATSPVRDVPVLLPQNGLHVEAAARRRLAAGGWSAPDASVVRAVSTLPAMLVAPGVVRQPGSGEIVLTEPERAGAARGSTETFRALLSGARIPVRTVPSLERELWRKVLVNAAINPVTALHRVPNGALRAPPYRAEAWALLREAQRAARVAGVAFDDTEADGDLERVLAATAENHSSMLQDVERGRRTEIDAISGEVLRTAAPAGIDLPATRAVLERLDRPPAATQPF